MLYVKPAVHHIPRRVEEKGVLDTAAMETLNATILEVIADTSLFPPNEGYRFTPTDREPDKLHINPRDPIYDGVVCDILHPVDGSIVAKKSPDASEMVTYCCGVSFEAWFYAMQRYHHQRPNNELKNPLNELSSDQLRDVVNTWFCPVMGHDGVVSALLTPPPPRLLSSASDETATWTLGERVESLQDAQPGDLIQYWRSVDLARPSGHSAVFLRYDPSTHALTYWSSQRKTNGIGENVEIIDPAVWELHVVRPLVAFHRREG